MGQEQKDLFYMQRFSLPGDRISFMFLSICEIDQLKTNLTNVSLTLPVFLSLSILSQAPRYANVY